MDHLDFRGLVFSFAMAFIIMFPAGAMAEKRIGVLVFSEEVRYSDAQRGIRDQLRESGFGEPAVSFTVLNAEGSKAKAAELARQFGAEKTDLIFTLGTSATIAVSHEIRDIPIVFAMVYDPVEVKIAKNWKGSGNNTTGASPRFPMSKLVKVLEDFAPVKRLAVLYTPGEKNSEVQLKALQALQVTTGIKVIPVILTNKEDVVRLLPEVARTTDAIYLTGSSVVGATVPIIVDTANKANVVTITHLDDLAEKGTLLGVCANSYHVGRLAGTKAVKILRGAKPSSIPIESEKRIDVILNMKTAKAGRFTIPPGFMKAVTKTTE